MNTHTVHVPTENPETGRTVCYIGHEPMDEPGGTMSFENVVDGPIGGVTPPVSRTAECRRCGTVTREGLLDQFGRCEECEAYEDDDADRRLSTEWLTDDEFWGKHGKGND